MDHNPNLRLHVEDESLAQPSLRDRLLLVLPEAQEICQRFEQTTGWVLDYVGDQKTSAPGPGSAPLFGQFEIVDLSEAVLPGQKAVHRGQCETLLNSINSLVTKLKHSETELHQWRTESDAAGRAVMDVHFSENSADPLSNLLRSAIDELSAQELAVCGATLYLLDDETTQLKLRSSFGAPDDVVHLPAVRPLEHSLADLEALVGNVVLINSPEIARSWKIPQPFRFGVCVMVGEPSLPLGTVWVFFEHATQLTSAQTQSLEVTAEKIANEVQSRRLGRQEENASPVEQELQLAATLNDCRLPSFAPEIEGWKVTGWTHRHGALAGVFHEWGVTPSGLLSLAIGEVAGPMLPAAMHANNLRSLLCAHRDYRHSGQSMVAKLNENLWYNSPGDDLASLIYLLLNPETNEIQIVNAGDGGVVMQIGTDVVSVDQFLNPLGAELDSEFLQRQQHLDHADTVVIFSQGLRNALCESTASVDDADLLKDILRKHRGQASEILNAIEQRFFASDFQAVAGDVSVIVICRSKSSPVASRQATVNETDILTDLENGDMDLLAALREELSSFPDQVLQDVGLLPEADLFQTKFRDNLRHEIDNETGRELCNDLGSDRWSVWDDEQAAPEQAVDPPGESTDDGSQNGDAIEAQAGEVKKIYPAKSTIKRTASQRAAKPAKTATTTKIAKKAKAGKATKAAKSVPSVKKAKTPKSSLTSKNAKTKSPVTKATPGTTTKRLTANKVTTKKASIKTTTAKTTTTKATTAKATTAKHSASKPNAAQPGRKPKTQDRAKLLGGRSTRAKTLTAAAAKNEVKTKGNSPASSDRKKQRPVAAPVTAASRTQADSAAPAKKPKQKASVKNHASPVKAVRPAKKPSQIHPHDPKAKPT